MKYTLIQRDGKIQQFFVLAVAEMYQKINGGTLVTPETLEEPSVLLLLSLEL